MAKIKKLKVINMACILGLFGVFMGLLFGIITALLSLVIPSIATFKIWQILLGIPVGYGVMMFITALIFIPLLNLTLKIVKGLHLDLDLTETATPAKKPIKPVLKSTTNQEPISQMTNSKTTTQKPTLATPIKPAI